VSLALSLGIVLAASLVTLGLAGGAHAQRIGLGAPEQWDAAEAAGVELPVSAIGTESTLDPELDYALNCRGCHRTDGSGTPGAVPELRGSLARFLHVEGGREYLGRVPGVAQSTLDDASLARLLNWMLVRFDREHVPADFRPFTADELAGLRRDPLVRASQRRAELLADTALTRAAR
jgi:hypothetical protein